MRPVWGREVAQLPEHCRTTSVGWRHTDVGHSATCSNRMFGVSSVHVQRSRERVLLVHPWEGRERRRHRVRRLPCWAVRAHRRSNAERDVFLACDGTIRASECACVRWAWHDLCSVCDRRRAAAWERVGPHCNWGDWLLVVRSPWGGYVLSRRAAVCHVSGWQVCE